MPLCKVNNNKRSGKTFQVLKIVYLKYLNKYYNKITKIDIFLLNILLYILFNFYKWDTISWTNLTKYIIINKMFDTRLSPKFPTHIGYWLDFIVWYIIK